MKRVTQGFFTPINPVGMAITGAYMMLWGVWLFWPWWDVLDPDDPLYHLLAFVPEVALGLITLILGIVIVIGSFIKMRITILATFLAFIVWLGVAVLLLLGDWQNPAWIGCALPSALSMYFYLNLSLNKDKI